MTFRAVDQYIAGHQHPSVRPWWMVVLGRLAGDHRQTAVRQAGHNPFNPAMIGYVVLLISFRYR
ncbi:RnfABCDGE type electron transport complex subunit D [Shigella flexneri]